MCLIGLKVNRCPDMAVLQDAGTSGSESWLDSACYFIGWISRERVKSQIMHSEPGQQQCVLGDRQALWILLGGMLGMMVAMGIGRFAFTPILPLMQRDLGMSNTVAGWLAGLNYVGYLAGAILCTVCPHLLRSRFFTANILVLSIVSTLAMGLTTAVAWWGVLRLVGGIASAVLFIVISAEVTESLLRSRHSRWSGALYGGIGLGIAFSGLLVPLLDAFGDWALAWIGMGGSALVLAMIGLVLGRRRGQVGSAAAEYDLRLAGLKGLWLLSAAYFFEGLGYVVSATFLVAIVALTPGLDALAPYSWVAVGLAAVPSTFFWPYLARKVGHQRALLAAYILQASGIMASIWADTVIEVLFVAVSFGGTFLGIVALTLAEGSRRRPGDGRRAAAFLTACFGIGQVLGPIIAGMLADRQDGFAIPLALAAACVTAGAICILADRRFLQPSF